MSFENYYEYNGETDLDAQTLFDYVLQQKDVQVAMDHVVPQNPEIFGKAAEPFNSTSNNENKDDKEIANPDELQELKLPKRNNKQEKKPSYFKWIIFILLGLLALYFLFGMQLTCNKKVPTLTAPDQYMFDTATPTVGSEFRAIFVR